MTDVAVVGLACRFPGGESRDAFWELLRRGGDGVGPVPPARWEPDRYYSPESASGTMNNREGAFLRDVDGLDHEFFAINPTDAAALDPHQRLLLSCAWHALEDAGVDPTGLAGAACGVYLGVMGNDWVWRTADTAAAGFTSRQGAGTGHHMAANRLSYQLNLRGPSLAIDTACSSSLVAVHLAARAVADGDCDYALAGGVNAILEPINGIYFTLLGLSAPDGRCKPFNAAADGMGRGEGVGVVVLRRLADARAAGQRVYAVVRGGAISHNGRSNGITAPARWGQQEAIERAYRNAGVAAADLDFVEAHGTGTLIGDAIEVNALRAVHAAGRAAPCAVGSVKGNIGHTEGAAGIASFIKATLAIHHRLLPPTVHGRPTNPALELDGPVLRLVDEARPLPDTGVLGGVSAFGLGGTNAHVVLAGDDAPAAVPSPGRGVFTVSAPTDAALRRNLLAQADVLSSAPDAELAARCHTSNRTKAGMRVRFAAVATSRVALVTALRAAAAAPVPIERSGRIRLGFQVGVPTGPVDDAVDLLLALRLDPVALLATPGAPQSIVDRIMTATELPVLPVDAAPRLSHVVRIGDPRAVLGVSTMDDVWSVAAALYRAGAQPQWDALYRPDQRQVRPLAPYQFAPTRFPLPERAGRDRREETTAWSTTGSRS
ncbi:beta-ketoacyl synthase N-terminal-like domain-containing protein [Asanoa sp. WMMD1127]|uniref:polyketide synthase n=1 Tax=Asanoa sp. WMMD1127 TaxID=3016107 RepID=UPI0024167E19|nr:polyketide synthase [Asanoa sp. WMMD1127]MDG4820787.1 beta-ketoacyl synthase N-terminal-like domain-containing protein [Asanoa sp. WMMD1127]